MDIVLKYSSVSEILLSLDYIMDKPYTIFFVYMS